MADSTLDPENQPLPDRQLGKGHGTGALGPSDTSDSGSDVAGQSPMLGDADDFPGDAAMSGSDDDLEGVGVQIGDADLDSDTDSGGTGERAAVGRDSAAVSGRDISTDHTFAAGEEGTTDGPDEAEMAERDPVGRQRRPDKQGR